MVDLPMFRLTLRIFCSLCQIADIIVLLMYLMEITQLLNIFARQSYYVPTEAFPFNLDLKPLDRLFYFPLEYSGLLSSTKLIVSDIVRDPLWFKKRAGTTRVLFHGLGLSTADRYI